MSESRIFSIRVPEDVFCALEKYRKRQGISRNKAILNGIKAIIVPQTPLFDGECYTELDVWECNPISFDELLKAKAAKKKL